MKSSKKNKHFVDEFVGRIIWKRRKELKMSLKDLAKSIGLTQQQVQKYEKGNNRISASKLYLIAKSLDKKIDFFFPINSEYSFQEELKSYSAHDNPGQTYEVDNKEKYVRLLKAFSSIKKAKVQDQILILVETLARDNNSGNDN